ncbi:unnamed protein product [Acanthocheilonema viteae]|uniref:Uncharacterized protein n=1 Tax=Acanthocheilonema viteae TaxID=6277 RepID=A0A498S5K0_ACAVI|nr:unnamed protein product [Acanthocheilonema viteae]
MNGCCNVILLFVVIKGQVVGLDAKDIKIGTIDEVEVIKNNGLKYPIRNENVDLISLTKSHKKHERAAEARWRCGDDQSYYFEPLNECYFISHAQFLNIDLDRKIAYGGTRNEYMFNCWQQYRGKLLDIVGFMINRKYELISQDGEHYDLLDKVRHSHRNGNVCCPSVCCVVFFADTRATVDVKMIYASCDNRTRALSYICEAPALI